MIELDRGDVVEEIGPAERGIPVPGRQEPARHERKLVEDLSGPKPGHERSGDRGEEHHAGPERDRLTKSPWYPRLCVTPENIRRSPDRRGVDHQRQRKVGREPVLAHIHPGGQPAPNHVPA